MEPDSGIFRALVERCPLVSYACDPEGRITYISPQIEEWTGLPARLWTEDPDHWLRMLHPDDRARVEVATAGCQCGQGFHLARPMPAGELTAQLLATSSRAPRRPAGRATARPLAWSRPSSRAGTT